MSRVKVGAGTSVGDRVVINVPDFKRRVKDEHPDTTVGERCVIGTPRCFAHAFLT